ncbi:hypothetical protein LSAT2_032487 [Lamellibrachia satsuma]|nr:hypothetical protein LSAT2_032487 [Lamellibrachia satsuma]
MNEIATGLPSRQESISFFAKFASAVDEICRTYAASIQAVQCEKESEAFSQLAQALNVFSQQLDVQPCINVEACLLELYFTDTERRQLLQNGLEQLQQFTLAARQCTTLLSPTEFSTLQAHCQNIVGIT